MLVACIQSEQAGHTHMNFSLQERLTAAFTYVFELGYFLTWFLQANDKSSEFIDFHLKQTNRIIKKLWLPAVACWLVAFVFIKLFIYIFSLGLLLAVIAIIFDLRGAYSAYKGQTKKII